MNTSKLISLAIAVGAALALTYWLQAGAGRQGRVEVRVPAEFSQQALAGKATYDANCAVCHGRNASGSANGPPLVHKIYEPGHHADESFYRAVANGVRAHHWGFGDMQRVTGVSREQVTAIIAYVRTLQRANGIE